MSTISLRGHIKMQLFFFIIILVVSGAFSACPVDPPCNCVRSTIHCDNKGLTEVPTFYRSSKAYASIRLQQNNITRIEDNAFANLTIGGSMFLSFAENRIDFISDSAFNRFENTAISINLGGNHLKSLPRALLHLNDVRTLTVDGLSDEDVDVMKHVGRTLRGFTLYGTTLNKSTSLGAMQYLSNLGDLSIMKVTLEKIHETAFNTIAKTLHYLSLDQDIIVGNFTLLCDLKSLRRIYVSRVQFATDAPPVPKCPTPIYSVQRLDMTQSQLENFPAALITFLKIYDLSLNQNNITDIDSAMVPTGNELRELRMSGNSLMMIPDALKKMKMLRYLDLSHNQIIALKDGDFQNLLELTTVFLSNNPITFVSNAAFQNCPRIQKLSLTSTMLVNVPAAITYLPRLNLLDVSGAHVKCDCRLVFILKQRPAIRGNCLNSSFKISDFYHQNIVSCGENPFIG